MATATSELVIRAMRGDGAAADALVRAYAGAAYALARRQLDSPEDAADAAQEALLAAYTQLGTLRSAASFAGWLRSIVRQKCSLVRRRARPADSLDAAPETVDAGAPSPELAIALREAVARLTPASRAAVELFYFDGLSCREVAAVLGTSDVAVRGRLHESRKALRRELREAMGGLPLPPKLPYVHGRTTHGDKADVFAMSRGVPRSRLYVAMYFTGRFDETTLRAAGLTRAEAEPILRELIEAAYLEQRDGKWACLTPVLLDDDVVRLRPWLQRLAEAACDAVSGIADDVRDLATRATAANPWAAGSYASYCFFSAVVRLSTLGFDEELLSGQIARGLHGHYADVLHANTLRPGREFSHASGREDGERMVWVGLTAHEDLDAFSERWEVQMSLGRGHRLTRLLFALEAKPVTVQALGAVLAEAGIASADPEAFAQNARAVHAVRVEDGLVRNAVPIVTAASQRELRELCAPLADEVSTAFPGLADELRSIALQCSFANCRFAEVAVMSTHLAEGAAVERLIHDGLIELPRKQGCEWGMFLVGG
jgi:RNA polymerase sigma-70 factor (ECF subfamily)